MTWLNSTLITWERVWEAPCTTLLWGKALSPPCSEAACTGSTMTWLNSTLITRWSGKA